MNKKGNTVATRFIRMWNGKPAIFKRATNPTTGKTLEVFDRWHVPTTMTGKTKTR